MGSDLVETSFSDFDACGTARALSRETGGWEESSYWLSTDARGRLDAVTLRVAGSVVAEAEYALGDDGLVDAVTVTAGSGGPVETRYTRDSWRRVASISHGGASVAGVSARDLAGRVSATWSGGGPSRVDAEREYDLLGRVENLRVQHATLGTEERAYGWDWAGRLESLSVGDGALLSAAAVALCRGNPLCIAAVTTAVVATVLLQTTIVVNGPPQLPDWDFRPPTFNKTTSAPPTTVAPPIPYVDAPPTTCSRQGCVLVPVGYHRGMGTPGANMSAALADTYGPNVGYSDLMPPGSGSDWDLYQRGTGARLSGYDGWNASSPGQVYEVKAGHGYEGDFLARVSGSLLNAQMLAAQSRGYDFRVVTTSEKAGVNIGRYTGARIDVAPGWQ